MLMPFVDLRGLIRSRSRFIAIKWQDESTKCQMLLPTDHAVTKLIVSEAHHEVGHALGVNATLAELGKRYWIPRARVAVKMAQRAC